VALNPDLPILGFARRMTAYKRRTCCSPIWRASGASPGNTPSRSSCRKAHPKDAAGKQLIEALHAHMRELAGEIPMAFLPDYDMTLALHMVSGSDVWLNTPLRPLEASGTSGMKAAFNGVPQFSVLDGWWVEAAWKG